MTHTKFHSNTKTFLKMRILKKPDWMGNQPFPHISPISSKGVVLRLEAQSSNPVNPNGFLTIMLIVEKRPQQPSPAYWHIIP